MQSEVTTEFFKEKPNFSHAIFGAIITGYLILLFLLYRVNTPITISIVTFDFLFVSFLFPLKGSLLSKTALLVTGNFVGLIWNLLQFQLIDVIAYALGDGFRVIFSLVFPILNCIWIVSFWCLGLSILTRKKLKEEKNKS